MAVEPGPEEARVTPALEETVTLPTLREDPSLVGAKLIVPRTPSPAGRLPPENENPTTIPVAALKLTSPRSDEAPVRSTPSVSN